MKPKVRRRWGLGFRILLAVAALALTVLVAAVQAKVVTGVTPGEQLSAAAGLAIVICIDNIRTAWRRHRSPGREKARTRMQKAVVGCLVTLAKEKDVDLMYLGGSVFAIKRRGPLLRKRLVRVLRFRLDDHPQASQVAWTPGKGVIGRCWRQRRKVYSNWAAIAAKYGGTDIGPAAFERIPAATRDGFTRDEFVGIVDKYAEVLAVPVLSEDGAIVGVVSIDVAAKANLKRQVLSGQDAEEMATGAAVLVRDDINSVYPEA